MTSPDRYPEFRCIKISEFWKNCQLEVCIQRIRSYGGGGRVPLCLFIDSYKFSLSFYFMQSEHQTKMFVNGWQRVLFAFEIPTHRKFCSNRSPQSSEEVLDGLCHSLSVDLSNTAWAQKRLINKLSENAFGTVTRIRPKEKYGDSYSTTFGTVTRIRP